MLFLVHPSCFCVQLSLHDVELGEGSETVNDPALLMEISQCDATTWTSDATHVTWSVSLSL